MPGEVTVETPPFRDPSLPFERRADDLLARLTCAEKVAALHQRSPAIPRLGIAEFRTGCEGVHGAAWRADGTAKTLTATVFPQPPGLAATWDPDLVTAVGEATGREIRALHTRDPLVSLNVWAPVVNLLRDPRWGRNEEGYSEDPLLTARMATAFCRGLAGQRGGYLRTAPTLKHFLAYNNEAGRDLTSSALRPRVLREYDLPPFREPLAAGAATGVMPSYNLVNGRPSHVSPLLGLLREQTRDDLLICSDAFAPSNLVNTEHYFDGHPAAHAAALRAGLDSFTDTDGDGTFTGRQITEALEVGLITEADVDRAVRRKLLVRLRLGEFDPDGGPHARDGDGALGCAAHRELAADAARRAIVVLKNEGGLLPLSGISEMSEQGRASRVAVVGPLAATLYEDWYSPSMPYQVSIADGLRAALRPLGVEVTVTEAAERAVIDSFGEFDIFDWGNAVVTARDGTGGKYLSAGEDGTLKADQDKPNGWVVRETFIRGHDTLVPACDSKAEPIRIRTVGDGIADAVAAARAADVAVVVVGNDPLINGRETEDRTTLELPPATRRLIRAVREANPRTVLVIMSSYPYALGWAADQVPAIVWTCHAGQETGNAVADILLGRHQPTGRLTQTWHTCDEDLPDILEYDIIKAGRTYLYFAGEPLYPFGHGLSYTTFGYSGLGLSSRDDTITARLTVTNTGSRDGTEVVQLYARPAWGPRHRLWCDRPLRQLTGFARVTLSPGQARAVEITMPISALACWDTDTHRMVVPAGEVEIMAGSSSADIRQTATLTVREPRPRPRQILDVSVAAADFDDYEDITLTDATPTDGDAVTPATPGGSGWIVFRDVDFGYPERTRAFTATVARCQPGEARLEVWYAKPGSTKPEDGLRICHLLVRDTGGKYLRAAVTAPAEPVAGPGDLYLICHGDLRLSTFRYGP
jgi:beta-glucosidase